MAWVTVLLLGLAITFASAPVLFEQYSTICLQEPGSCLERSQLTPGGLRELEGVGISLEMHAAIEVGAGILARLVWVAVGALVFVLRSDDRMALLVAFFLVSFGTATFASDSVDALVSAHYAWWLPARGLQILGEVCAVLFFLTFPDGRFVPRWMLVLAVAFLVFQIPVDLSPNIYSGSPLLETAQSLVFLCFVLGMIGSQVYRYRRVSAPDQRRQTRWVVFGTTLALSLLVGLLVPLFYFAPGIAGTSSFGQILIGSLFPLVMLLIPLSVGVAMLRSGLFDIDRVINRTLVYGALTAVLVLVYLGGVAGLAVRPPAPDRGGFAARRRGLHAGYRWPLRPPEDGGCRSFIDRRFYRRKYDAAKTLEAFSARLRDETDLDALNRELVGVVRDTVQPERVALVAEGAEANAREPSG